MRVGDDSEDRRRIRIGPTVAISGSLISLAFAIVYAAGGAIERLKSVEVSVSEIRTDMRDLTRTVSRIEVRTAAMDRRNGVIEEAASTDRRPR